MNRMKELKNIYRSVLFITEKAEYSKIGNDSILYSLDLYFYLYEGKISILKNRYNFEDAKDYIEFFLDLDGFEYTDDSKFDGGLDKEEQLSFKELI